MSLIGDALGRAREEAARRDAIRRGVPPPHTAVARRESPSWIWGLVVLLAVGLGMSLLAVLLLLRREPPANAAVTAAPTATVAVPGVAAPGSAAASLAGSPEASPATAPGAAAAPSAGPAGGTPTAAGSTVGEVVTDPARGATPEAGSAGASSSARGRPAAPPAPAPAPSRTAGSTRGGSRATAPPAAAEHVARDESGVLVTLPSADPGSSPRDFADAAAAGEARVFVREAVLPDGATLTLGGIAWSETGPFALLNGRVVGPGERVEGYRVVEIEPRRVQLRGHAGTLFIGLE